ncbi:MAG: DUF1833 domain-containing protein [Desulfovibrio sp.]|nr:DUF1833 domain-containing protein [Desulfovibrio sp.]
MEYSAAMREAYANATPATYYATLEFSCADLTESIRVVDSDRELVTADAGTFVPVHFEVYLPETEGGVRGELKIDVTCLPREAIEALRDISGATAPIYIQYREYLAPNQAASAWLPTQPQVSEIVRTFTGVTITARLPDLVGAKGPRRMMTAATLPGAV